MQTIMRKTHKELRLGTLVDERETVQRMHEELVSAIQLSDDKTATESQNQQLTVYREKEVSLDEEIAKLAEDVERDRKAAETSKLIRRTLASEVDGVELDGEGIVYRDFYSYARDVVLTRQSQGFADIKRTFSRDEIAAASERLELLTRTPANTLSSNVAGLQPAQHIDQIFQVINKNRPLVDSANRTTLERGTLTYPAVSQRPIVAVQGTEKTEAGNQGMVVDMETATASTYLGGGDLSWQAINWSTPDALQLWFDLAAADYALKTEQDAAQVIIDSGQGHVLGTTFNATTGTFANLLTAIGAGASAVYTNSGRIADTVYMSPDAYWYIFGLTSTAFVQFASVSDRQVGPMNFVVSRGLHSHTMVVGDSQALLVAETAGAPVELRAVEPAIGGLEVGIIGAFEAVVVDPGAFTLISAAS